jgi:hypothetical protein
MIKPGERMAIEYFQFQGYSNLVHEPDGNIPPDVLIDGNIAVEVRRLNQHIDVDGAYQPLEYLEYKLAPWIIKMIRSYNHIKSDFTSYVSFNIKRPLNIEPKDLLKAIKSLLEARLERLSEADECTLYDNFKIKFRPSKKVYNKPFVFASYSDDDGGGLVIGNILENLKIIVEEKERKILPYKDKYEHWWLAVNDNIGFGIDDIDLAQLESAFNIPTFFKRIIFISPFNSKYGKELIISSRA